MSPATLLTCLQISLYYRQCIMFVRQLQSKTLPNASTNACRIDDIAKDIEQQQVGKLHDKMFSIQLDKQEIE